MFAPLLRSAAVAVLAAGALAAPVALAQVAGTRITVGTSPAAVTINPVTNKLYVANSGSNNVTVVNLNTGAKTTLPAGAQPMWIATNPESNTIYVPAMVGANVTVIDGATDTVTATLATGGGGWTAINPLTDTAYVLRYGGGDEVNVIEGETYVLTSATRSFQPVSIVVNPVNNRIFMAHQATGDIVAMNMTTPVFYPPLLCPDGAGGFKPQPPDPPLPPNPDPYQQPCINVPDVPVAAAINPVTNKIYAVSSAASNQVSVINGSNHTFTSLTPPVAGAARTIAVNPVTNKIYAAFAGGLVVIDGATNAMTVLPTGSGAGGPAAIGINVLTNMVYVPNADGTMLVLNATTGTSSTIAITAGANGIAVNPLTNMVYVLDSAGGVTPVTGAAGSATTTGITTTITPLAGNTGGTSGSITINAASTITPAPLNAVRRVYYRFGTTGPWSIATGSGPYTASYTGFTPGTKTLQAFATNGLEAPAINSDLANVPIVGNVATYQFTVPDPNLGPAADLSITQVPSTATVGVKKDVMLTMTVHNAGPNPATDAVITSTVPAGSTFIWASSACGFASGTVTCTVGTLANGGSRVLKVVLRPGTVGTTTHTATVASMNNDPAPANNSSSADVAVAANATANLVQRYRLYSDVTKEHHFTTDFNEYTVLGSFVGTWVQEGPVGRVLDNPGSFNGVEAVPYYRLYDTNTRWHHWTTDANEYYTLIEYPNWNAEGVDGYILPTATAGATELFRLNYPYLPGLHHWTIDANEYTTLIAQFGWVGEGGSGFVIQ